MRNQRSIIQNTDPIMIGLFIVLVIIGWMNIYAAVYNDEHKSIFDLSQNYGKQAIWIGGAVLIALAVLILDGKFFAAFSFPIYILTILTLLLVLAIARDVKGAVSWIDIGSFKLQPSEFAKFATNMALAKYLSTLDIKMKDLKTKIISAAIIILPAALILLQNDTGSALVYAAFIFVLYREGLSGNILILIFLGIVLFVLTLLVKQTTLFIIILSVAAVVTYFLRKKT